MYITWFSLLIRTSQVRTWLSLVILKQLSQHCILSIIQEFSNLFLFLVQQYKKLYKTTTASPPLGWSPCVPAVVSPSPHADLSSCQFHWITMTFGATSLGCAKFHRSGFLDLLLIYHCAYHNSSHNRKLKMLPLKMLPTINMPGNPAGSALSRSAQTYLHWLHTS